MFPSDNWTIALGIVAMAVIALAGIRWLSKNRRG